MTESEDNSISGSDFLGEVAREIGEMLINHPQLRPTMIGHSEKVVGKAEEYGQYLRTEWQKAREAGLTQYDEKKDKNKEKWFWWNAYSHDFAGGRSVYFAPDETMNVSFYMEGKPKPDPLHYLENMIWGARGEDYNGLELIDYQVVLLAIIHDAQNWQAGRKRIYFNRLNKETLPDRLCQAVWNHLESKIDSQNFRDVKNTIKMALQTVKAISERIGKDRADDNFTIPESQGEEYRVHEGNNSKEWDVFICHASEDNATFVEPLANALKKADLRVWYDRFELTLGDSLREKIDEGLAKSRYGVVVLSKAFFKKEWPRTELDALVTRQNEDGKKLILPIWHDIGREEVGKFSPILASILAAQSSEPLESIVAQIEKVLNTNSTPEEQKADPTKTVESQSPIRDIRALSKPIWPQLLRRKLWLSIGIIIAVAIVAAIFSIPRGIPELVRENGTIARVQAAEMMMESGPDFIAAAAIHEQALREYILVRERRPRSSKLRLFYPKYSPQKRLEPVASVLSSIPGLNSIMNDQETAKGMLWRAGEQVSQFCMDCEEFHKSKKGEDLGDILRYIDAAMDESHERSKALENDPNLENAQGACMANRRTVLLLGLARKGYDNKEKLERISSELGRASELDSRLADTLEPNDKANAQLLRSYATSEKWRRDILNAMMNNDEKKVSTLTKAVIDNPVEYERKSEEDE